MTSWAYGNTAEMTFKFTIDGNQSIDHIYVQSKNSRPMLLDVSLAPFPG